jgi:hypothetical protein
MRYHADSEGTMKIISWQRAVWCKSLKAMGRYYLFPEKKKANLVTFPRLKMQFAAPLIATNAKKSKQFHFIVSKFQITKTTLKQQFG